MKERLQKLIAASGLCSRRAAEELITAGRVRVNGSVASVGDKADTENDLVTVDGKQLHFTEKRVYLMLNKPVGYVTTLSDEKGRKTAAELVQDCGVRVFPVGRLDLMSEGLLLFTNDGEFMQRMLHPKYEINKTYRVEVSGDPECGVRELRTLREIDGEVISSAEAECIKKTEKGGILLVTIHEGKNRQVRRMCAAAGMKVLRLCRVAEHGLELGDLPCGKWRYLTDEEMRKLPIGEENRVRGDY